MFLSEGGTFCNLTVHEAKLLPLVLLYQGNDPVHEGFILVT